MATYYTYPTVGVDTIKTVYRPLTENDNTTDTVVLFAPFKGNFGPINEIKIVHSIDEFKQIYGDVSFDMAGQSILLINNWLRNGGTVYAMRVEEDENFLHASTKYDEDYWNSENIVYFKPNDGDVGLSDSVEISSNIISTAAVNNIDNFILRGRCLQFICYLNKTWSSRGFFAINQEIDDVTGMYLAVFSDPNLGVGTDYLWNTYSVSLSSEPTYVYNPITKKSATLIYQEGILKYSIFDMGGNKITEGYETVLEKDETGDIYTSKIKEYTITKTDGETTYSGEYIAINSLETFSLKLTPISNITILNDNGTTSALKYFPYIYAGQESFDTDNIRYIKIKNGGSTEEYDSMYLRPNVVPFQNFYENFVEMENIDDFLNLFTKERIVKDENGKDAKLRVLYSNNSRTLDIWPSFINNYGSTPIPHFNFPFGISNGGPTNNLVNFSASEFNFRDGIAYMPDATKQMVIINGASSIGSYIHNLYVDFNQYSLYSLNGNIIIMRRYPENYSLEKMSYMMKVQSGNRKLFIPYDDTNIQLIAKYPGSGYNSLHFKFQKNESSYTILTFRGIDIIDMVDIPDTELYHIFDKESTQYSKYFYILNEQNIIDPKECLNRLARISETQYIHLYKGADSVYSPDELVRNMLLSNYSDLIKDTLKYPIDYFLDAGYSFETKKAIYDFFCSDYPGRDDVQVMFDCYPMYSNYNMTSSLRLRSVESLMNSLYSSLNSRNASIFIQYFKTRKDNTSEDFILVTPTYFLSLMIPYNFVKKLLPVWEPVSGLLNGKLPEFSGINEIPSKSRKEYLTLNHLNYVDNQNGNYYFSLLRTRERYDAKTALRETNNSVLTNRLIKGITALCREFLFDYNDEITLINLKKSLNLYISEYVTNGALTYASINVQRDDDENISVTMNVRYPEMLEVITLTLNID